MATTANGCSAHATVTQKPGTQRKAKRAEAAAGAIAGLVTAGTNPYRVTVETELRPAMSVRAALRVFKDHFTIVRVAGW